MAVLRLISRFAVYYAFSLGYNLLSILWRFCCVYHWMSLCKIVDPVSNFSMLCLSIRLLNSIGLI